ncbi:MAG TPA: response regulator transcription factor [Gaiellaceae bacterium]|nr:response regulator transcription factor [Gaiellaceae bacterium]
MADLAKILLADDDRAVLDAISHSLERERFDVETAEDGEDALQAARSGDFDAVILNVMMPRLFGTDVCRTLRAESEVPIILLSARDSELDRVLGLELGADDYVTKPFSMVELVSRVRALLRRRDLDRAAAGGVRQVGDIRLDFSRHQVTVAGEPVHLTRSEFRLLVLLAEEPERVFSRREIMEHLWQSPYVGDERACDIHISNLRRKIEADPRNPGRLVTVRGIGYTLVPNMSVPTHN